ncbi:hypothetical protein DFJ73DRAFT_222348 [Zopfochytrium polystomum]|nr:hypothetical protein DFJ73DRAFT_222348 [Zopfochytrium polystomum]
MKLKVVVVPSVVVLALAVVAFLVILVVLQILVILVSNFPVFLVLVGQITVLLIAAAADGTPARAPHPPFTTAAFAGPRVPSLPVPFSTVAVFAVNDNFVVSELVRAVACVAQTSCCARKASRSLAVKIVTPLRTARAITVSVCGPVSPRWRYTLAIFALSGGPAAHYFVRVIRQSTSEGNILKI